MTISAKGLIEWTTNPEMEGGTVVVTVLVLDERASMAAGVFAVTAVTVNPPPALAGIGPQTVEAGEELIVKPSATDPNDTELVYTATELPFGAVFDPETGFRWTPADDQVGVHEVTFVVTDPHGAKASESVTITVTEAPKKPALTLLSSATVVGEYTEEPEATLNEVNKTFTVKMSGAMRFYRLRTTGETKLRVTSLRLEGDNAVIAYEIIGDKEPALTLLSSATVVGEYTEEPEAILDEVNKTFTVKMSGAMRFYRLRTTGETKLKMTSLQLQGDNAVIAYEIIGE